MPASGAAFPSLSIYGWIGLPRALRPHRGQPAHRRPIAPPDHVVANFMSVPDLQPEPPTTRTVGFVGRFSPEKGPDLFCDIARECSPDIAFEMFGEGAMRARWKRPSRAACAFKASSPTVRHLAGHRPSLDALARRGPAARRHRGHGGGYPVAARGSARWRT